MSEAGDARFVKPLVWDTEREDVWVACGSMRLEYRIIRCDRADDWSWFCAGTWRSQPSFEAAKAAAQAEYAARILSAIDLDAIRREARNEALREAAACCDVEADRCDGAVKWGGSKRYVSDCKAAAYAMRDRSRAITAMIEDKP